MSMARLPDFEAWVVFARVAETGSFTRAALALGLSKATVSKAVARLEARLGAPLFNRTSRRLALTETGRVSAAAAARLLAEAEAIEEEAQAHSTEPRGLVRITAPMSFGLLHLAPLLPALFVGYPEITVDLDLADEVRDLIAGRFDLALRIASLPDSSLRAKPLCQVPRRLVGAPSYFARHGQPSHPDELAKHSCLGYAYLPVPDRWRFRHTSGEEVEVAPKGPLRANNAEALAPALMAGIGLAVQPEFLIWRALKAGVLEAVMADWSLPPIALNIVTPPGRLRPARVLAVIDFLAARLATAEWAIPGKSPGAKGK
jgi:DNA-binding transcriptional LysR family regulator